MQYIADQYIIRLTYMPINCMAPISRLGYPLGSIGTVSMIYDKNMAYEA